MGLVGLRDGFEDVLKRDLELMRERIKLCDAIEYALLTGGKRFRPLIVISIAQALGSCNVKPAALAVEYFHTASLIADDLPCMDNDAMRRGEKSLHCAFDETTALLASYALICAAFERVHENAKLCGANEGMIALEQAARAAGLKGATGGQFLDLFPPDHQADTLLDILNRKTVTLFETAFVLGWVFGGGDLEQLDAVRKAALHFGLAFQIGDDLCDFEQDTGRVTSNYAVALGRDKAAQAFYEHTAALDLLLKKLHLDGSGLKDLKNLLMHHLAPASSA